MKWQRDRQPPLPSADGDDDGFVDIEDIEYMLGIGAAGNDDTASPSQHVTAGFGSKQGKSVRPHW